MKCRMCGHDKSFHVVDNLCPGQASRFRPEREPITVVAKWKTAEGADRQSTVTLDRSKPDVVYRRIERLKDDGCTNIIIRVQD